MRGSKRLLLSGNLMHRVRAEPAAKDRYMHAFMQDCIQLTVACASSYERACLSHRALLRISATRIEPLLLLNANKLQWLGWKSAPVMTCSTRNAPVSTHVASIAAGVGKPAPSASMHCTGEADWNSEEAVAALRRHCLQCCDSSLCRKHT